MPDDGERTIVFLQGSQIPEAYAIGCLQDLQIATVEADDAVALLLNLKSKLDLAEAITVAELRGRSEAEERCGCDPCKLSSLLLAFSTALFSYSSQSLAVFPGVVGGVRGSLKGDVFLASGDG
jgi:hypothetical protein